MNFFKKVSLSLLKLGLATITIPIRLVISPITIKNYFSRISDTYQFFEEKANKFDNLSDSNYRFDRFSISKEGKLIHGPTTLDILKYCSYISSDKNKSKIIQIYEELYQDPKIKPILDVVASKLAENIMAYKKNPQKFQKPLMLFLDNKTIYPFHDALFGGYILKNGASDFAKDMTKTFKNTFVLLGADHEKEFLKSTIAHEFTHFALDTIGIENKSLQKNHYPVSCSPKNYEIEEFRKIVEKDKKLARSRGNKPKSVFSETIKNTFLSLLFNVSSKNQKHKFINKSTDMFKKRSEENKDFPYYHTMEETKGYYNHYDKNLVDSEIIARVSGSIANDYLNRHGGGYETTKKSLPNLTSYYENNLIPKLNNYFDKSLLSKYHTQLIEQQYKIATKKYPELSEKYGNDKEKIISEYISNEKNKFVLEKKARSCTPQQKDIGIS